MTARAIIRNYLFIAGTYTLSASLIWGVNTLFLLGAGLNIFEVFIANAVFTGSMALFEIPTGVLADTNGRRMSFLLSVVIVALGTLGYVGVAVINGGLGLFCLMSVVLGLGYTFYSGAVEAWLVDALNSVGYEGNMDQVFAHNGIVSGAAMLIGAIAGGFLGNFDLTWPFLARAALLAIVFVIAFFSMRDIGFSPRALKLADLPLEMGQVARAGLTYGWNKPSVRLMMIMSFLQMGFLSWGFYAWQPYFLDLLGREAVWVAGFVSAAISLAMIAGNTLVEWFTRFCGKRTTLFIGALIIQAVTILGVGFANSFWLAVIFFLLAIGSTGVMGPVKQAYLNKVIPSEQRATVISFDSLVGSIGGVAGQSGLGYLAQERSIASGYILGGFITLIGFPVLFALRRLSEDADVIIGQAGQQGACAGQGLPDVASVDSVRKQAT